MSTEGRAVGLDPRQIHHLRRVAAALRPVAHGPRPRVRLVPAGRPLRLLPAPEPCAAGVRGVRGRPGGLRPAAGSAGPARPVQRGQEPPGAVLLLVLVHRREHPPQGGPPHLPDPSPSHRLVVGWLQAEITGHKRQKAEVPSDPESVDDEALPDNLSDVSHSGSVSGLSSSSGSSSSSTTDGGSSSGESNSD